MRELELLSHIQHRSRDLAARFPGVEVGPGDDCAVLAASAMTSADGRARRALLKVDQVVEGRHFLASTPLERVAHKAIARPLSDIAAMGGEPLAALASVVLPETCPQDRADKLFDLVHASAINLRCPLVGGDIASSPEGTPLVLSISILGACDGKPYLRRGARAGDVVYATGTIGGSFGAERAALAGHAAPGPGTHHLWFEPRIREALWLRRELGESVHAMMDISDGLGIDAWRLGVASGVVVEIDGARVPLAAGVPGIVEACGAGEDYELLFAASSELDPRQLAARFERDLGTRLTPIGRILDTLAAGSDSPAGSHVRLPDGSSIDGRTLGFEHGKAGSNA